MTPRAIFQRLKRLWVSRILPDMEEITDSHQKTQNLFLLSFCLPAFLLPGKETEYLDLNKVYLSRLESKI